MVQNVGFSFFNHAYVFQPDGEAERISFTKGQIRLDGHGPVQIMSAFRVCRSPSLYGSTSETSESLVTWGVKTDPKTWRPFNQDGGWKRNYCWSLFCNYSCMQFKAASLLLRKNRKHSTWWKSTSVTDNNMENITLCYRKLLLLKWWNVFIICEEFKELLSIIEPVNQRRCNNLTSKMKGLNMRTITLVQRVVTFLNSTTWTCRLCLWPDQPLGQNRYMSRLNK